MSLLLEKDQLPYTACYCEENVYQLCKHIRQNYADDLDRCTVVFISNELGSFPMWRQQASKEPDQLVVWDYHVILLVKNKSKTTPVTTHVYDLDTTLPFPCSLTDYIIESFQPHRILTAEYQRCFRLIPAGLFLQHFASDRSHMISQDGSYYSPPPPYPPITSSDGDTMTLPRYRAMNLVCDEYGNNNNNNNNNNDKYGKVVSEDLFFDMS